MAKQKTRVEPTLSDVLKEISPLTDDAVAAALEDLPVQERASWTQTERERLSASALTGFFNIVGKWGVEDEDARNLLGGVSSSNCDDWKKYRDRLLDADCITRISLVIGIYKALRILYSGRLVDEWVRVQPLAFAKVRRQAGQQLGDAKLNVPTDIDEYGFDECAPMYSRCRDAILKLIRLSGDSGGLGLQGFDRVRRPGTQGNGHVFSQSGIECPDSIRVPNPRNNRSMVIRRAHRFHQAVFAPSTR
jgi:hypothetical protein